MEFDYLMNAPSKGPGKPKGKHPDKALTALKVKQVKEPGRYADGNGLYLVVDPSGAKRWLLRIMVRGKRVDIGLGGLSWTTLAEARDKAYEFRRIAKNGGDPLAEKRTREKVIPTFQEAAEKVHAEHEATWKNPKHAQQWINTLKQYAFPNLGQTKVDQIDTPDILKVLEPIWLGKQETARRVRQRISSVFDWAKAAGHRSGDNPVEGVIRGLPKQPDKKGHHDALPYDQVPSFLSKLKASQSNEITKLAFEFLILTAARTSEVLCAEWSEIDWDESLWTVPATRMKAGREHRVPLPPRAIDLLRQAKKYAGDSNLLFPGRDPQKPMSNMVFLQALRRMELPVTAHGFRSSFRDWAAETTNHPREIAEMALAHTIANKVEAAYRRGDLLEKRRALMNDWGSYVTMNKDKRSSPD